MRILVIDDDKTLIDLLRVSFGEQNYAIDAVEDGEDGWTYVSTYTYDLIILDWSLPKLDGISLCKRFRACGYDTPILLLSARSGSQNKIKGLDAGADDYLSKPFDVEELAARIRALLRRSTSNTTNTLNWGDLHLNSCTGEVTYQEQIILLTAKEYSLLELFLRHNQEVFSIEEIIENLWSSLEYPAKATVRSHLRRLRNQLKLAGLSEDPIETVRGRGYCLKSPPSNYCSINPVQDSQGKEDKENKKNQHLSALTAAWKKYQHRSIQQLTTLESALQDLENRNLNESDRKNAKSIAHTLAGNLGVFGFDNGSKIAREIEQILSNNLSNDVSNDSHKNINQEQKQKQEQKQISSLKNQLNTLYHQLSTQDNISPKISPQCKQDYSQKDTQTNTQTNTQNYPLILIIDNDETFTQQLTQTAKKQKIRTAIASNPKSARKWLDNKDQTEYPNAVILKICFAKLTYQPQLLSETLSLIAEFKLCVPSIPAIVIADSDRIQDRLQVARHGSYFYLKQLVPPTQIISFCQQVLKRCFEDKKIMFIDDDPELLQALPSLLNPWKFKLTTLNDPRQFWDVLQIVEPNLLVLDIEMPYISGIELCKVLRNHPYWHKLPVLFLSVHTDISIREQVLSTGADDFLNKPFSPKQLAARILNCIERRTSYVVSG